VVALATIAGGVALVIRLTQKARPTEIAAEQAAQ